MDNTATPRARSRRTPRYRRSRRSISTPPRNGTTRPGRVTTITCQLTASVECVADMMYQLTLMKFMPLPNSDTNIAVKKNRKARWLQRSDQSTRCAVAVAMEPTSLQNFRGAADHGVGSGRSLACVRHRTPSWHLAKIAPIRVRMEGWRQRRLGGTGRNERSCRKMEGLEQNAHWSQSCDSLH